MSVFIVFCTIPWLLWPFSQKLPLRWVRWRGGSQGLCIIQVDCLACALSALPEEKQVLVQEQGFELICLGLHPCPRPPASWTLPDTLLVA